MISPIGQQTPSWQSSGLPDWFQELQRQAWEAYQEAPFPSRRDEPWRFGDLKRAASLENFSPAGETSASINESLVERSRFLEKSAAKLIFVNETLVQDTRPTETGLICAPFAEAVSEHGQPFQEYFMTQEAPLGSKKFALLHKSRTRSGLFLYVPAGMELTVPIEVYHHLQGENTAIFPHTLIVTGEGAKITVIDYFLNASEDDAGLSCGVVDLVAGQGSQIRYVACQDLNTRSLNLQISSTLASRDADVKSLQVQLGAAWSRTEAVSHLTGPGANSDMLSLSVPSGTQEIDQRTLQHHAEPHTTSDLLYKNALADRARTTFAGLIKVDQGAHYTDAFQTCRNLLLSDTVEANAMPGLEINADQVKCSHGSTSGPITDEEVFYFNARGIPSDKAKQLIALGFTNEVLHKFGSPSIEDLISRMVEQKFKDLA